MKKVMIKLGRERAFWFLGQIELNADKPCSKYFDPSILSPQHNEIIQKSVMLRSIFIVDEDGKVLKHGLPLLAVDVETKEELPLVVKEEVPVAIPIVNSVTVSTEELEEPGETPLYKPADYEEALLFLGKNANTVKAMIRKFTKDTAGVLSMLHALQDAEVSCSNRAGVLKEISKKLEELE